MKIATRRAQLLLATVLPLAAGCALFRDPALDDAAQLLESSLDDAALAAELEKADALYREPRDTARVEASLGACLAAVSPRNDYAALWRAARACYWLAGHHADEALRREFGLRGALIGKAASERAGSQPASHYYHALNLGRLSELEGRGVRRVPLMADLARRVIELDERYESAGGHRFLGILLFQTMDNAVVAFGDLDEALEHLERACELAPDYGGNQLALAEALLEDGLEEEARGRLERVLASEAPLDDSELWREWQSRARELIAEMAAP